jgi:hypothetical protein
MYPGADVGLFLAISGYIWQSLADAIVMAAALSLQARILKNTKYLVTYKP